MQNLIEHIDNKAILNPKPRGGDGDGPTNGDGGDGDADRDGDVQDGVGNEEEEIPSLESYAESPKIWRWTWLHNQPLLFASTIQ